MTSYVIRGANILGETVNDIAIEDGVITAFGSGLEGDETIDATGLVALPGLVDLLRRR